MSTCSGASVAGCRFELEDAVHFIIRNGYSRIGLQFPPDLLCASVDIYDEISRRTSASVVILGDTPYSNCCVDELAGKRWGVDAIIHFGNACLTGSTGKVGVFYAFGDIPCFPSPNILREIRDKVLKHINPFELTLFFYDFRCRSTAKKLADELVSSGIDLVFSEPALPGNYTKTNSSIFKHAGRVFDLTDKSKSPECLIYLGDCDSAFYSILVSLKEAYTVKTFTVDPTTGDVASAPKSASNFLRRRYFLMEKVKSAKRIGILMGTLSISRYRDIVARLKRLLQRARKPYTTVVIGRINEAKLMNLPDLDAFVLIACPQTSIFDDPNLPIPIVTPFELECVLHDLCVRDVPLEHPRRWNGLWLPLDFAAHILDSESGNFVPEDSVIPAINVEEEKEPRTNALMVRDVASWSLALACEDLLSGTRDSWRGLDPALGQTSPLTTIQPGRTGLPTNYTDLCE